MKLFDLQFGKEVSGRFLLRRRITQPEWEDKIVELQQIDEGILGFEAPNSSEHDLIVEAEADSPDAKILMWELLSGQVGIVGCIMKVAAQQVEIKGRAFTLTESEIPVQLQIALTDEFIETVVMSMWREVKTFEDAKRCLEREFLLDKLGYWFVTSGVNEADFQRGFTVLGSSRALDIGLSDDRQQLVAKRIVKHRRQNLDTRPIYLIRPALEFCDQTVASTMRSAAIAALAKLVTENNSWIASWKLYNSEEARILEERYGQLPPLPYRGIPRLQGDGSSKTLLVFNLESSANLKPWIEHISGDGLPVTIQGNTSMPEGFAVDYDQTKQRLIVAWESDDEPPSHGIISPSMKLAGSRQKKRDKALNILETASAGLPYLGLIFEGKTFERALPRKKKVLTKTARRVFGETGPNPVQEKALRIALTTPDIALIQGPPGTGKTRVIQALLTMLNEGVSCIIEGTHDGQFSLCCPFGLPDGFRWVRLLNFATSQCEEGKKILEHLQTSSREAWKRRQPTEIDPVSLARLAYDKVIFEVGIPPTQAWQRVWEELERLEQSRLLLERGFDEVDTTIVRSQRVLEQLMLTLLQLDPIPQNIWEPYKHRDALQQCLKDTVIACGGSVIPEQILSTNLGAIRNVIDGGKDSLRPYVATLLLSASRRYSLHRSILENLLREHHDFLPDTEQIAHIRNSYGAHAGGSHNAPIILVEDLVTKIYQIVPSVVKAWRLTTSKFHKEV